MGNLKQLQTAVSELQGVVSGIQRDFKKLVSLQQAGEMMFNTGSTQSSGYNFNPPAVKPKVHDKPKFAVGDWFVPHKPKADNTVLLWVSEMDRYDNTPCQVTDISSYGFLGIDHWCFHPDWCEKVEIIVPENCYKCEDYKDYPTCLKTCQWKDIGWTNPEIKAMILCPYAPKPNMGCVVIDRLDKAEKETKNCFNCGFSVTTRGCFNPVLSVCCDWITMPKVNQPKPPVIGEMAIFWNLYKRTAVCAIFGDKESDYYYTSDGHPFKNAIPFESVEQYKQFIKS